MTKKQYRRNPGVLEVRVDQYFEDPRLQAQYKPVSEDDELFEIEERAKDYDVE